MLKSLGVCQECENGNLHPHSYDDTFQHNGQPIVVTGLECALCDNCQADPILVDQVKSNQKKITDAKRKSLGLLTGDEIFAVRNSLNLTQQQAAEVFGGGKNSFSKYERGEVIQSVSMDRLLRLLAVHPEHLSELNFTPTRQESLEALNAAETVINYAKEKYTELSLNIYAGTIKKSVQPSKPATSKVSDSQTVWSSTDQRISGLRRRHVA